jgi:3-isopropylmalate/(R)-2-methylmalate dehydratase small subunit
MPKQFLKGITRDDLARGVFYDLRFDAAGAKRREFILNRAAYRDTRFLIVGPNFGCGSSREHAVWGLRQFGIRALLGTSFASIFYDNCFRNGVLPIVLPPSQIESLQQLCADPARNVLRIDLSAQTITLADGLEVPFVADALGRDALLQGRDAVAATLQFAAEIQAFEQRHWAAAPWLKPPTLP